MIEVFMNTIQLAIFSSEAIIIAVLVLFLFRMRSRFGLSPLYITLGVFQPVQTLLASTVYVEVLPGVIVSPGSVVMFTASQFVILLVYIFEDAVETRKTIYGIMFANLTMTLLLFMFGIQLELLNTVNFLSLSREILNQTARIMLTGTIVLFADVVLIIFVYEAVWRLIPRNLFLRIYLTMALVLIFDSLAFTTAAFYGQPDYVTILTSGIIGKLVMAAFYALALSVYLRFAESTDHKTQPFQDIFHILSYRQKFEIEHQRGQQTESLLRESEGKYQTLARISPVGIFRTNANGITTYVNPKWCEISGISFDNALGDGWLDAVHPDDKEKVSKGWQESTQRKEESSSDYRFVRPDGATAWVMGRAVPEMNSEGQIVGYVGTITDITERKQAEEQVQRQLQRLEALRRIDMAITSGLEMNISLGLLLEQLLSILTADAADILLFESHTRLLRYAAGRGFRSNAIQHTQLPLESGHAGRAALERRAVHIHDLANNPDELVRSSSLASEGFKSYFAIPLVVKGRVKGVLEIFHRSFLNPDHEWINFTETMANQAAITIEDAQLVNELQRSNLELAISYDATIEGWSRALDMRDKETEGHTQRVTEKTLALARLMGLPEEELIHIRRGALLHDIGKMGVPDGILFKPGSLTGDEWETMRKHTTFAYEMLSPIRYLKSAGIDIPYCHHEKWDGTGYPRGLMGEQIPLAARIFAVVDVWDAITSDRPYRSAWTKEKAVEYIKEQSGKHFDPQVVNVFLKFIS
jgi:PAS domain S-box-containing protein/putative nucleotidyltransferase with HDIG domain